MRELNSKQTTVALLCIVAMLFAAAWWIPWIVDWVEEVVIRGGI